MSIPKALFDDARDAVAGPVARTPRRSFLLGSVGLSLAGAAVARAAAPPTWVYVGTFSSPQGPEGSIGRGKGIHIFRMDPATGALTPSKVIESNVNPSCLAFSPSKTHLYSANETSTFEGAKSGSVSAYTVDRATGHLTLLNTVSSQGAGPCFLSVHPSGKHVLVANYHGGSIAVLPILANGGLGPATFANEGKGAVRMGTAASAPPGSFALSGHDRTHAHMILADPSGRFVLATDLGQDRIFVWKYDEKTGKLQANDPAFVPFPQGDGPRHFYFHPNGRWFYSIQEEGSTLAVFDYDAAHGKLTPKQTISSLPAGFAGTNYTSEVLVPPDGKFLYAANRLHDAIAWFSIGPDGRLKYGGEAWTRGDYPRSFNIDPSGNFLYSCNQRADAVTTFRVNRKTGELTFTGQYTPVGTPSILLFLA